MFTERALKQFKCEWSLTVIYIYIYKQTKQTKLDIKNNCLPPVFLNWKKIKTN